jgi:hypothetical protein
MAKGGHEMGGKISIKFTAQEILQELEGTHRYMCMCALLYKHKVIVCGCRLYYDIMLSDRWLPAFF